MRRTHMACDLVASLRLVRSAVRLPKQQTSTPHSPHGQWARPECSRSISTSTVCRARRKPKLPNFSYEKLQKLGLVKPQGTSHSEEDRLAYFRARYTPEQFAAIAAGEAAINPSDLNERLRRDPTAPQYFDDFSRIERILDKKPSRLRGDGMDYAEEPTMIELPDIEEDIKRLAEIYEQHKYVGHWEEYVGDDGKTQYEYVGREQELRYLTDIEFLKTREARAYISQQLSALRPKTGTQLIPRTAGSFQVSLSQAPQSGTDSSEAQKMPSDEDLKQAPTIDIDYTSHPKWQEIYTRRESEGPMRKRFGLGTLESEREIERYMTDDDNPNVSEELPKIFEEGISWSGEEIEGVRGASSDARPKKSPFPDSMPDNWRQAWKRISKRLNMDIADLMGYYCKVLLFKRVSNQTALGKIPHIYTATIVGDRKGNIGLGEGKALTPDDSKRLAQFNAYANMMPILMYEQRTIFGEVEAKLGATIVKLSARPPGFGVRTNAFIFEIARAAGLQDLAAKAPRARNPMNMIKATVLALRAQRDPEEIARGRGKKLVDVRKVYYSGRN